MLILDITLWQLLLLFQYEILLFAGIFFVLDAIDVVAVDLCWLWLRSTERARTERLDVGSSARLDLAKGEAPAWLSLDYRERVAGDAEPPSGVALTLSTRF